MEDSCVLREILDPPFDNRKENSEQYRLPTSKENPGEAFTISTGRNRTSGGPDCVLLAISTIQRLFSERLSTLYGDL